MEVYWWWCWWQCMITCLLFLLVKRLHEHPALKKRSRVGDKKNNISQKPSAHLVDNLKKWTAIAPPTTMRAAGVYHHMSNKKQLLCFIWMTKTWPSLLDSYFIEGFCEILYVHLFCITSCIVFLEMSNLQIYQTKLVKGTKIIWSMYPPTVFPGFRF